ncbi:MAG: DUF3124 domain-containing protein [Anaerolineae bacterium]|nr:DUF3124 domain-containing protein [Anaerolineae bacterium]
MWGKTGWWVVLALMMAGCGAGAPTDSGGLPAPVVLPVTANDLQIVTGQRVYVPAYSQVFLTPDGESLELAVTLAIHNTDSDNPLIIREVSYYNTEGALVRNYITEPVQLPPLATTGFIVSSRDQSGGWGANFIVEWGAEQPVYEPVIEAVMVSTRGTQGVSLVSPGRVLSQTRADD